MRTDITTFNNIDEYISGFPDDVKAILEKVRETIRGAAPGAKEAIKYQMPTYVLNGNLVHFAAYKNHLGFYPTPSGIENFRDELFAYELSKGTIRFPLNKSIPYDLIRRIVEFRVMENSIKVKKNR